MKNKLNRYTVPKIYRGKEPTTIPKKSSLQKELAKNKWYVNYCFNGKQYRISDDINRIKEYSNKEAAAQKLLASIKYNLDNGIYPDESPEEQYKRLIKTQISIQDAISAYLEEARIYARKKTIQSYESKLKYLSEHFKKPLREISGNDIQTYIQNKIKNDKWTPNTVKTCRAYFRGFFNWCLKKEFIERNPIKDIELQKLRSENIAKDRHIAFSQEDAKAILNWLDENDKFAALFCRTIYYTCLRPKEIGGLHIKDVDLVGRTISVQVDVTKNTKKTEVEFIYIDEGLFKYLNQLNLDKHPKHYYLFSNDSKNIVGANKIGQNSAYNKFIKAVNVIGLDGKGYTLYSFKHFGNIQRYNAGWKITEIQKLNRHSSISMTERYLRQIIRTTEIHGKNAPLI